MKKRNKLASVFVIAASFAAVFLTATAAFAEEKGLIDKVTGAYEAGKGTLEFKDKIEQFWNQNSLLELGLIGTTPMGGVALAFLFMAFMAIGWGYARESWHRLATAMLASFGIARAITLTGEFTQAGWLSWAIVIGLAISIIALVIWREWLLKAVTAVKRGGPRALWDFSRTGELPEKTEEPKAEPEPDPARENSPPANDKPARETGYRFRACPDCGEKTLGPRFCTACDYEEVARTSTSAGSETPAAKPVTGFADLVRKNRHR